MSRHKIVLFILFFLYYCILKIFAFEYQVKNDTEFNSFASYVNGHQNSGELILNFVDDYYDFSLFPSTIDITVQSNITFVGNGTVFDYGKVPKGRLLLTYPPKGYLSVSFKNIIFNNYGSTGLYDVEMMMINVHSDNYYFKFDNCTFQNSDYRLLRIDTEIHKWTHTHPSIILNNCNFYNNTEGILKEIRYIVNYSEDLYKTEYIQFNNCTFINNRGLFILQYGRLEINNCYFNTIEKNLLDTRPVVFLDSYNAHDDVIISNSIFEDINVKSLYPMFSVENMNLKIENTSFKNCKAANGFLFHIKNKESLYKDQVIYFKNNTFQNIDSLFSGDSNIYIIEDSIFKDINQKNSFPAITGSQTSKITISNTHFYNISLTNGLFKEDSYYSLNNISLKNIKSNSKAVLQFFQNNVDINGMEIEDIKCVGDGEKTSFLLFDSGEARRTININNIHIKNCISNGPFIKFIGDLSEVNINNSEISNIISYGSIIKDTSLKSLISISNLNFNRNKNVHKLECGNIYFSNNLSISIENSSFTDNYCQNGGGAICIDDIESMDLNLTSNTFSENKSINGGALYLRSYNDLNTDSSNNIQFNYNLFEDNFAENFGGAIYSEYSQLYKAKTVNNSIINNKAGVIGGGVYSPFAISKNLFNINSYEVLNNTANGLINNYASKPMYIVLNTKLDETVNEIRSGDYFPLTFTLYDEFDQIYVDIIKYYSLFNINLDLTPKYDLEDDYDYEFKKFTKIMGNKCYFNNGICELNEFQIYGIPNDYILEVKVENFEGNIEMKFDPIEIKVLNCDDDHIKMYDKNGILSCEIPLCKDTCPISSTAVCKPYKHELENNKEKNRCVCLLGWEGDYCEKQKIVNFRILNIIIIVIEGIGIFLMMVYIVFLLCFRNKRIIRDIGKYKIFTFIVGIISFFISNYFITYTNSSHWMLYFCFKHFGIGTVLFITFSIVAINSILGIDIISEDQEELEQASLNSMLSSLSVNNINGSKEDILKKSTSPSKPTSPSKSTSSKKPTSPKKVLFLNKDNNTTETFNITNHRKSTKESEKLVDIINRKKETSFSEVNNVKDSLISMFSKSKNSASVSSMFINDENIKNQYLIISMDCAHSTIIELICFYIIFNIVLIFTAIFAHFRNKKYNMNEDKFIFQKNTGYWTYKCPTEDFDLIFNLIELIIFILIVHKGRGMFNLKLIFRFTQHITSSLYIGIIFGPIINIIGFYFLGSMRLSQVIFNFTFNTIAYWLLLSMFSWNIVRSIVEGDGNNIYAYFLSPLSEKCVVHHSYRCDCIMKKVEGYTDVTKKYIEIYRFCSKPFEIVDGKIKFNDVNKMINLLM